MTAQASDRALGTAPASGALVLRSRRSV